MPPLGQDSELEELRASVKFGQKLRFCVERILVRHTEELKIFLDGSRSRSRSKGIPNLSGLLDNFYPKALLHATARRPGQKLASGYVAKINIP